MAASAFGLEEDKELLLSRSQDLKWTDDVTGFQCVRCDRVLIKHYIANCGHKFCLNCKKLVGDGSKRWRCPVKECNKFIEDIHLQDGFFEETVFELNTHCPNHKYGCPVIGPLKDIGGHLRKCQDTRENALPVILDQSKSLDSAFVIKQMSKFNEKIEAIGSTLNQVQRAMEEKDLAQERKWTGMDRKCTEMDNGVVRSFKEETTRIEEVTSSVNKNSSQLNAFNAKLENLGKDLRRDLQNQVLEPQSKFNERLEKMSLSLNEMQKTILTEKDIGRSRVPDQPEVSTSFIVEEITALKKKVEENEENLRIYKATKAQKVYNHFIRPEDQHMRRICEYYKEEADFTLDINSLTGGNSITKLFGQSEIKELLSEVFPLRTYPFSAQVRMRMRMSTSFWNQNNVYFDVCFKDAKETNKSQKATPIPNIFLTLKDPSNKEERKNIIKIANRYGYYYSFKQKLQYNCFYFAGEVNKSLLNSAPYNVQDKVEIDVHVEAPEVAQLVYSHDGTLTWAIDDFRKKKQAEVDGLIECDLSPYFYSSAKGYRVQVHVYLNGCREYKKQGVSIMVVFLNGVYDEDLNKPIKYKITATILHPTKPHRNISKSKQNSSLFNMISSADIESFLHNNTLYYKVTVEDIK